MDQEDQFGGRTDDDLFSDDIEPVEEVVTLSADIPTPAQDVPAPTGPAPQAVPAAAPSQPPRSLAQSRHNTRRGRPSRPSTTTTNNNNHHKPKSGSSTPGAAQEPSPPAPSSSTSSSTATPPARPPREPSRNTASAVSAARLNSGANPRTRLTEAELAERLERMRVVNERKTQQFERARQDESAHAEAYARGMEEARRRRELEAERRRRADEDRRRLDEERARNRERKLAAMADRSRSGGAAGAAGGSWDDGKDLSGHGQGDDERRTFRSAHGGVRGSRSGLGGSRFASAGDGEESYDGFGGRGRGGARGGRGRGRGGRGGSGRTLFDAFGDRDGGRDAAQSSPPAGQAAQPAPEKKTTPDLAAEDFPALPSAAGAPKKVEPTWVAKPSVEPVDIPLSPAIGKWDEEVAAMEANAAGTA